MTEFVAEIREEFGHLLEEKEFIVDKTGVKTLEIVGASFVADEPTIFGKINHDYIERELAWYQSKSLYVKDIPGKVPEIWEQVADKDGIINSNYGFLIWSQYNGNQYLNVIEELRKNPNSRRAVMIYNRPSMHNDYCRNGRSDFICTNAVQYLIRNNVLEVVVQMRSNDVVFGYRNDYAWQSHVASLMVDMLKLEKYIITWQVGSLHVYERDFWRVEAWYKTGNHLMTKKNWNEVKDDYR